MVFSQKDSSYGGDWPLNAEVLHRMTPTTLVGQSYKKLDAALACLRCEKPRLYRAINAAYLDPDVSHSEVDFWREKALRGSKRLAHMVQLHDEAISWMAKQLEEEWLWVRWPAKTVFGNLKDMSERHKELVRLYKTYRSEGYNQKVAVRHASIKLDYSERQARRIIVERKA